MIRFSGLEGIAERFIAYLEALSFLLGLWKNMINSSIVFWLRFEPGTTWKLELFLLAPYHTNIQSQVLLLVSSTHQHPQHTL
jgi:hypothetical protein